MNLQGRSLKQDLRGEDVARIHRELALIGLTVPQAEKDQTQFGPGTFEAVTRFQSRHGVEPTGVVDAQNAQAINAAVDALTFDVDGSVVSRSRVGVNHLNVHIVDKNVGNDVPLADALTETNSSYKVRSVATDPGQRGKERLDLRRGRVDDIHSWLADSSSRIADWQSCHR